MGTERSRQVQIGGDSAWLSPQDVGLDDVEYIIEADHEQTRLEEWLQNHPQ